MRLQRDRASLLKVAHERVAMLERLIQSPIETVLAGYSFVAP